MRSRGFRTDLPRETGGVRAATWCAARPRSGHLEGRALEVPVGAGNGDAVCWPSVARLQFLVCAPESGESACPENAACLPPLQKYSTSMDFVRTFERQCGSQASVRRLRAHPAYHGFNNKWNLPVYFQIRSVVYSPPASFPK